MLGAFRRARCMPTVLTQFIERSTPFASVDASANMRANAQRR